MTFWIGAPLSKWRSYEVRLWAKNAPLRCIIVSKNAPKFLIKPEAPCSKSLHKPLVSRDRGAGLVCLCMFLFVHKLGSNQEIGKCCPVLKSVGSDFSRYHWNSTQEVKTNTFAIIGTEFDIHNPSNSFLKYHTLECSGMFNYSSYWSWASTNHIIHSIGKIMEGSQS